MARHGARVVTRLRNRPARAKQPAPRRAGKKVEKRTFYKYRRVNPLRALARIVVQVAVVVVLLWLLATRAYPALRHVSQEIVPAPRTTTPHMVVQTQPSGPLTLEGAPSLDATQVDAILDAYGSPLKGHGSDIVDLSNSYQIDDAVAIAFFVMESRAGTQGEAVITRNFGNLRPMPNEPERDGYRYYTSWVDGATEWFSVMKNLYLNHLKLRTVEDIVPVYAPSTDSNDPVSMTAGIRQLVSCWRGVIDQCPPDPAAVRTQVASGW